MKTSHLSPGFFAAPLAALSISLLLLSSCSVKEAQVPLRYPYENSVPEGFVLPQILGVEDLPSIPTLPDPLLYADGRGRVKDIGGWEGRRQEIIAMLEAYEIGVKPVTDKSCIEATMVHNDSAVSPVLPTRPGAPAFQIPLAKDTLLVKVTVKGRSLTIHCPVIYPESGEGPFPAVIGIGFFAGAGSLPSEIFSSRNIAMIGYPYTDVMEHTQKRGEQPINALYPEYEDFGAYAAWPWGVSRVIDALEILGEGKTRIDVGHIAITGCSFAGKMALFSGALDERIALTIAQEPGGGGAAAWRFSETLGNVETLGRTNYSWFKESMRDFSGDVSRLPIDHHELCALVAPRALLVLGNPDYEWLADESGYVSCYAARKVWEHFGVEDRMGWSFQDGHMHCALPEGQWPDVECFVDRFLLGRDVPTEVMKAPMFEGTDAQAWCDWEGK